MAYIQAEELFNFVAEMREVRDEHPGLWAQLCESFPFLDRIVDIDPWAEFPTIERT